MKKELDVALALLMSYVHRFGSLSDETIELFRKHLQQILLERYQGHWYPDKPIKGQAYRSLEFNKDNDYCDVIVSQICHDLHLPSNLLGIRHDLTLWVDPYEVTIRLGNHVSPKENQQLVVARFDHQGNELIQNDLDTLLSQSRTPIITTLPPSRLSPTNSSSCDSASCSGSSTPQRTSSPYPIGQQVLLNPIGTPAINMHHSSSLFTPPRALSPQAPAFQMSPSAPIKVPVHYEQIHPVHINNPESISCEGSPSDGNHCQQPDRSDTPHSMHSTTSNESSDSGYCGYVESFPYYYKLNRLYKALAIQKLSTNTNPNGRGAQSSPVTHQQRRAPQYNHQQQPPPPPTQYHGMPSSLSTSPPTPTPMNINQLSPFYTQQSSYLPTPMTVTDSRKSKY